MSKILVIAAHPDDELLGLGATIRKKVNNGDVANAIVLGEGLTSREAKRNKTTEDELSNLHQDGERAAKVIGFNKIHFDSMPDNRFDSLDLLDIIKIIENYLVIYDPEIIYTHHPSDRNIDHRIVYDAVMTATRPVKKNSLKKILTFETPSSTEWGFQRDMSFKPNIFEDVTEHLFIKIKAMSEYLSETRDFPHPRSSESLEILASYWGIRFGIKYVEAFESIWEINL